MKNKTRKTIGAILVATAAVLAACDARVTPAPAEKSVEKNTTIINPPAKEEKKVEKNITIINPPAEEKKK